MSKYTNTEESANIFDFQIILNILGTIVIMDALTQPSPIPPLSDGNNSIMDTKGKTKEGLEALGIDFLAHLCEPEMVAFHILELRAGRKELVAHLNKCLLIPDLSNSVRELINIFKKNREERIVFIRQLNTLLAKRKN